MTPPRAGMRELDSDNVKITLGGDLLRKLWPYIFGAAALGGVGVKWQHDNEMAMLKADLSDVKREVRETKDLAENTDGKVDTIIRLLRRR